MKYSGMIIYLNEAHTMPMVHGMVAVRGGSKRDQQGIIESSGLCRAQ
ncbi:MAG: hypothetical protein KAR19_16240 [Bacteroidales bacterium]|nr:hypothetical protein [Bacteroidales bacterium]